MTAERKRILGVLVNNSMLGNIEVLGQRLVYLIDKHLDEHQVLNIIREIVDEDFADNTVRLDAIHSVIHAAKREGILPLRTV